MQHKRLWVCTRRRSSVHVWGQGRAFEVRVLQSVQVYTPQIKKIADRDGLQIQNPRVLLETLSIKPLNLMYRCNVEHCYRGVGVDDQVHVTVSHSSLAGNRRGSFFAVRNLQHPKPKPTAHKPSTLDPGPNTQHPRPNTLLAQTLNPTPF